MLNDNDGAYRTLAERLASHQPVLGMAVTVPSIAVAEIAAHAGFHFAWIETEHSTLSLRDVETLILALEHGGCVPFVRVRRNDENEIGQALDMGARGVIIPHVDNAEAARKAVHGAKYYPVGRRGYATMTRSTGQGMARLTTGLMAEKNDSTMLVVQIESAEAVDNVREIAAIEGVDMLFIGYADLCQDLGIDPDPAHPECAAAIGKVSRALKESGKYGSFIVGNADQARHFHDLGFDCLLCGMDSRILKAGMEKIAEDFRIIL